MNMPVAWRQKEDPADMRSAWHFWTRRPPVGAEPLVTAASLADAQAEIARLRGALDAVYEFAHDPAILTICREATQ